MIIDYNKLKLVLDTKKDIKSAMAEKKLITEGDDTLFEEYADKIRGIKAAGQITSFEGELTFASFEEATDLNHISAIGALLWKAANGSLVATNGDSSVTDYWDPKSNTITTPTKAGHTLIGVCVGYGKWAYVSWTGLTKTYKHSANTSDDLYNWHPSMVHGTGYENTEHVLTNHANILTGTIWEQIKLVRDNDGIPVFLPSKYELLEAYENICDDIHNNASEGSTAYKNCSYNKNLGKLLSCYTSYYWSSSQSSSDYSGVFSVYFSNGLVSTNYKTFSFRSVALLHFGA